MKRLLILLVRAALATIGLGIALADGAPHKLALEVYLLVLGGLALEALARSARAAQPAAERSEFEQALRRSRRSAVRPSELVRLEDQVALASVTAGDAYYRLRPLLRAAAAELLAVRRGIELDPRPERSQAILGGEAWAFLRPDLEPPADRFAPGPALASLEAVVAAIERI